MCLSGRKRSNNWVIKNKNVKTTKLPSSLTLYLFRRFSTPVLSVAINLAKVGGEDFLYIGKDKVQPWTGLVLPNSSAASPPG